jgi:DNA-binding beta-propeller fold protein YncE
LAPAVVLAGLLGAAAPALAANQAYWTNIKNDTISFANLDNTGGGGQLKTFGATPQLPLSVAIDAAANKVYWANPYANTISFADLDGSGGGQLNTAGATPQQPAGVAIDPAANKIYWSNEGNDTISYANLDNTGGGGQLNVSGTMPNAPSGLAIDAATNRIYWFNALDGTISFANLDNTGDGGQLTTTGTPALAPTGVAIDAAANKIYWTDALSGTISFANLDGSGGGQLNTAGATPQFPVGVAIDAAANKIYWTDALSDTISFANLDDTGGGGQLDTSGATANEPSSLALLERPSGTGAPALTGGTMAGSALSCSQGAWAADSLGTSLSHAPHSYTYAWTRDGQTIPGATTRTIVATSGGDYACQVTAQNHAGGTTQTSAASTILDPPTVTPPPALTVTAPVRSLKLTVSPRRTHAATRVCLAFRTTWTGRPVAGATVHFADRSARTSRTGKVTICRPLRPGSYHPTATKPGFNSARASVKITPRPRRS